MTTQRRIIILGSGTALIAATLLLAVHPWIKQVPTKQYSPGQTVTYTDAVTGSSISDLPGESGNQMSDIILPLGATINGLDSLKAYLTDAQYLSVSNTLTDFLLAHSGLSAVTAGVQKREVAQSNNTLTFVLVVDRPAATYTVKIDASNSQSPSVTLEEAE